jgi:hypothetical protein
MLSFLLILWKKKEISGYKIMKITPLLGIVSVPIVH